MAAGEMPCPVTSPWFGACRWREGLVTSDRHVVEHAVGVGQALHLGPAALSKVLALFTFRYKVFINT